MLVLSRRKNQAIVIDGDVRILVTGISGKCVRLAVEAPPHVRVDREEIANRKGNMGPPANRGIRTSAATAYVGSDVDPLVGVP